MVKYDYINYVYDQVFHNMSLLSVNDTACTRKYSFWGMNKVEIETSSKRSVDLVIWRGQVQLTVKYSDIIIIMSC